MKQGVLILVCLFLTLFTLSSEATNIVERSHKSAPQWVNGICKDFIITTAIGSSIENAKNIAIEQVRDYMITSIAVHVESERHVSNEQLQHDGQYSVQSNYAQLIKSQAGDIPFLHNVSPMNVEDYYWEKVKLGKDNYEYHYSVKYPFSDEERNQLIEDFLFRETKLDAELQHFSNHKPSTWEESLAQITEIDRYIAALSSNDERRLNQCKEIIKHIKTNQYVLFREYIIRSNQHKKSDQSFEEIGPEGERYLVCVVQVDINKHKEDPIQVRVGNIKANGMLAEYKNSSIYQQESYTQTDYSLSIQKSVNESVGKICQIHDYIVDDKRIFLYLTKL